MVHVSRFIARCHTKRKPLQRDAHQDPTFRIGENKLSNDNGLIRKEFPFFNQFERVFDGPRRYLTLATPTTPTTPSANHSNDIVGYDRDSTKLTGLFRFLLSLAGIMLVDDGTGDNKFSPLQTRFGMWDSPNLSYKIV